MWEVLERLDWGRRKLKKLTVCLYCRWGMLGERFWTRGSRRRKAVVKWMENEGAGRERVLGTRPEEEEHGPFRSRSRAEQGLHVSVCLSECVQLAHPWPPSHTYPA